MTQLPLPAGSMNPLVHLFPGCLNEVAQHLSSTKLYLFGDTQVNWHEV